MTAPSVPLSVWIWAAFDPVLIGVALWLGWHADQAGKILIGVIAALGISLLATWLLTLVGIPWVAPLSRDAPMLVPVRTFAALAWTTAGYAAHRFVGRK